jgi:hypothetical protein
MIPTGVEKLHLNKTSKTQKNKMNMKARTSDVIELWSTRGAKNERQRKR